MKKICLQFSLALLCLISVFGLAGKSAKAAITAADLKWYYPIQGDCNEYASSTLDMTKSATYAAFDDEIYGGGLHLTGSEQESNMGNCAIYGNFGSTFATAMNQYFSISLDFIHATTAPVVEATLLGYGETGALERNNYKIVLKADKHLKFEWHTNAAAVITWTSTNALTFTNALQNFVLVGRWGVNMNSLFKVYLDGSEIAGSWTGDSNATVRNAGADWRTTIGSTPKQQYGLNGYIGDVAYFNRILTSSEITALQSSSILTLITPPLPSVINFGYPYLWSGNDSIFKINETKRFIVAWNVCAFYGTFDHAKIFASLNGELIGQGGPYDYIGQTIIYPASELIGPQKCQGIITYFSDPYLTLDDSLSGTIKFYLKTYDANNTVLSTAESGTLTYTTKTGTTFINNGMVNPLMIDLGSLPMGIQTATTTTLFFTYNFKNENAASTTVYLWDYVNATSTGYYTIGPFSTTGDSLWQITIPTPATSTSKLYRFLAVRPGYPYLQSEVFTVNWSFTPDTGTGQTCSPPSYDFSHTCDDIENATSTLFGQLKCSIKFGLGVAGVALFSPSCDSLFLFQDNFNSFKKSFPFNTFYEFVDTIDVAIDTAIATTTGNTFSVPFIRKTATSTEYYTIPVIGSSTYPNLIGINNYNTIRLVEEYLYWIGAAVLIYFIIIKKKV